MKIIIIKYLKYISLIVINFLFITSVFAESTFQIDDIEIFLDTKNSINVRNIAIQKAENAGIDGGVVADEVSQKDLHTGYDANKGEYVDMVKAGIIDPVKVVRVALTNAASISGLLLTTEALVTNLEKEDAKKQRIEGSVR